MQQLVDSWGCVFGPSGDFTVCWCCCRYQCVIWTTLCLQVPEDEYSSTCWGTSMIFVFGCHSWAARTLRLHLFGTLETHDRGTVCLIPIIGFHAHHWYYSMRLVQNSSCHRDESVWILAD